MNTSLANSALPKHPILDWLLSPQILRIAIVAMVLGTMAISVIVPRDFQILVLLWPLAIVVGVISVFRPEFIMLCAIAYIPFEEYDLTFLPISLSKIFGVLVIGLLIFNVLFRARPFRIMDDSIDFMILIMAVLMLFSILFSEFQDRSISSTIRLLRMFLYYFALKNLITKPDIVHKIMWLMSIGGMSASLWGINNYLRDREIFVHDTRVSGIDMDPNVYALLAILCLIVTVYLLPITHRKRLKIFLLFNAISLLAGIILSGSRGGLLSLAITGFIFILTHPQRIRIFIIIVLLVTLSWPVWPSSVKARFGIETENTVDDVASETATKSLERRSAYVDFGLTLLTDSPIFGVGYGSFAEHFPRSEFARFDNPTSETELIRLAHNTYLEIVVGTGIIGLFAYLIFLFVVLKDLFLISHRSQYGTLMWSASRAFLLCMIAYVIASSFLSIPYFDYLWIIVAITSALRYFVLQDAQFLSNTEV